MTETTARTIKAIAIADRLQDTGCDPDTAAALPDAGWQQAAQAAAAATAIANPDRPAPRWVDASPATRQMVIGLLTDRQRTATVTDLFAAFT